MSAPRPDPDTRLGAWRTLLRGLAMSPALRDGLGWTLLLALGATAGKTAVPVVAQRVIDDGVLGAAGPQPARIVTYVAVGALVAVATVGAGYGMNLRLVRATEQALSELRVTAFRHIHDLSLAYHEAEHRGSLVSRVTADIDTISRFMQWGGVQLLVNLAQLTVAVLVMSVYSPALTAVVLGTSVPLVFVLRAFQRRLSAAYDLVRHRVGVTLTSVGESVMGADVIRAYHIEDRTDRRVSHAIERQFQAGFRAGRLSALMTSTGEVFAAVTTAAVVAVGVLIGVGGALTAGQLVAFLFLVNLFVAPLQIATEILDQAQTAIAGWRRVLGVLDEPAEVADPGRDGGGRDLPAGPVAVGFDHVWHAYPRRDGRGLGPHVLHDVDLDIPASTRVAVVGETGSGKTTLVKLLVRLADPTSGAITLNGVPLDELRFSSLRRAVAMVPQDDVLFAGSVADNVRLARPGADEEMILAAFATLGLDDWLAGLPHGLATQVGARGGRLSVGERQLVALARAQVGDPALLVLDEATSSVDPLIEARIQRALARLTDGRTSVAIAHRLSTAEAADEVWVCAAGRIVQRGPHHELVATPGPYQELHRSWVATYRSS